MKTFNEFGLSEPVLSSINNMGFEEATPIQEKAIPLCLEGKDLIGQAHTGTGKTVAFGIPLVEMLDVEEEQIQGLIMTPTRELAVQVAEELNKIGQFKKIRALPIYGGQDIGLQIRALKKRPQVIVGTPGRLMDHMRRRTIRLGDIKIVVLDEADEMLNMGFIEDIQSILQGTPEERQTLLFSATMPAPIQALSRQFMKSPVIIRTESRDVVVPQIEQSYLEVEEKHKFENFCRLLDIHAPERSIVFGRTKRRVDELFEALNKRGYSAEGLHGDLTQSKRDMVVRQFKEGTIEILVATDVAARGLDITGVTHVYNFDIPQDPEGYVHRIGRTGRAGAAGMAVTLVTPREIRHLKIIESTVKSKINRLPAPTFKEAFKGQQRLAAERIQTMIEKNEFDKYRGMAEKLLEETDSVSLIAAALQLLTREPSDVPVNLTEEQPVRSKLSSQAAFEKRGYQKTRSSKKAYDRGSNFRRGKFGSGS
jgi:ATP-dependent RNA helicase DeaD